MSRFDDAPDKYWHCMVGTDEDSWYRTLQDMTKQELIATIIEPWKNRRPIVVSGTIYRNHDLITTLKIVQTDKKAKHYQDEAHSRGNISFAYAEFHNGDDFTAELMANSLSGPSTSDETTLARERALLRVDRLCRRFPQVARQLQDRHEQRDTLEINDEYDVQDLFHALLRIDFEDVRDEEWTPSYAGGSSRVDFLLKPEQVIVEVKKTRQRLGAREVGDQLLIDIARYRAHPDCRSLVCFVYDPEHRIGNPRGLETDLARAEDEFEVRVIISPD